MGLQAGGAGPKGVQNAGFAVQQSRLNASAGGPPEPAEPPEETTAQMAVRLFSLHGVEVTRVSGMIGGPSDSAHALLAMYLGLFEFGGLSLVASLRVFLSKFSLMVRQTLTVLCCVI